MAWERGDAGPAGLYQRAPRRHVPRPARPARLQQSACTLTGTMQAVLTHLCATTGPWDDDARVANSAPIECARSRQTVKRSDLVGWAEYG